MKNVLAILSAIVVFASCSDKAGGGHSAPELQAAHELMQERPDSALKVRVGFDIVDSPSRSVVNEYQILVAEALYKNDYQQTNASAVIAATAYYDSVFEKYPENSGLAFETARAHYYKAVGETEDDDIVAACADYLKAADIMEEAFPEIEKAAEKGMMTECNHEKTRFMALIYYRLGEMFFIESFCRQAIEIFSKSLKVCPQSDSTFTSILLKKLGDTYCLEGLQDSALLYFRQSLDFCGDNIMIQSDVANQMALIYHDIGEKDTAYQLLYKYVGKSVPDNVSTNSSYNLGILNYNDLKYDSAAFYLERSFANGNSLMKFSSAQMLAVAYDSLGYSQRASSFSKYALDHAVKEINRSAKTKELTNYYGSYKTNRQEEEHRKENLLYVFFAVLLASSIIPLLYSGERKNRKLSETVKKQGNVVRNLKSENKKLKLESNSATSLAKNCSGTDINECLKNYAECPIGCTLIKRVLPKDISKKNICDNYDIALTDNEKILVRSSANRYIPSFTDILTKKFGIKGDNILLCCLAMLGFSVSEIAVLIGTTYQAANKRINFIKEKLGTDSDIVSFITAYMHDFYTKHKV